MITKFKLFESPDGLFLDDTRLNWRDDDSITFGYCDDYDNEDEDPESVMCVGLGSEGQIHSLLGSGSNDREDIIYPGRLWYERKCITFWEFPTNYVELMRVIKDIEDAIENMFGIILDIDDTWYVEVVVDERGKPINPNDKQWSEIYDEDEEDEEYSMPSKLIKIKDYPNL